MQIAMSEKSMMKKKVKARAVVESDSDSDSDDDLAFDTHIKQSSKLKAAAAKAASSSAKKNNKGLGPSGSAGKRKATPRGGKGPGTARPASKVAKVDDFIAGLLKEKSTEKAKLHKVQVSEDQIDKEQAEQHEEDNKVLDQHDDAEVEDAIKDDELVPAGLVSFFEPAAALPAGKAAAAGASESEGSGSPPPPLPLPLPWAAGGPDSDDDAAGERGAASERCAMWNVLREDLASGSAETRLEVLRAQLPAQLCLAHRTQCPRDVCLWLVEQAVKHGDAHGDLALSNIVALLTSRPDVVWTGSCRFQKREPAREPAAPSALGWRPRCGFFSRLLRWAGVRPAGRWAVARDGPSAAAPVLRHTSSESVRVQGSVANVVTLAEMLLVQGHVDFRSDAAGRAEAAELLELLGLLSLDVTALRANAARPAHALEALLLALPEPLWADEAAVCAPALAALARRLDAADASDLVAPLRAMRGVDVEAERTAQVLWALLCAGKHLAAMQPRCVQFKARLCMLLLREAVDAVEAEEAGAWGEEEEEEDARRRRAGGSSGGGALQLLRKLPVFDGAIAELRRSLAGERGSREVDVARSVADAADATSAAAAMDTGACERGEREQASSASSATAAPASRSLAERRAALRASLSRTDRASVLAAADAVLASAAQYVSLARAGKVAKGLKGASAKTTKTSKKGLSRRGKLDGTAYRAIAVAVLFANELLRECEAGDGLRAAREAVYARVEALAVKLPGVDPNYVLLLGNANNEINVFRRRYKSFRPRGALAESRKGQGNKIDGLFAKKKQENTKDNTKDKDHDKDHDKGKDKGKAPVQVKSGLGGDGLGGDRSGEVQRELQAAGAGAPGSPPKGSEKEMEEERERAPLTPVAGAAAGVSAMELTTH